VSKTLQSTTLWSTKDGADKTYTAAIVANAAGGWDVIAENGRRGGPQTRQANKETGVDEATARKAFAKLVAAKIKGGYKPLDADPVAIAASSERGGKSAGIPVALLHFIDESEIVPLLERGFVLAEKHDGHRRLVIVRDGGADVAGVKRSGEYVPLPVAISDAAAALGDAIIDGEIIGDVLHVFDVQRLAGEDVREQGFMVRFVALKKALARIASPSLAIVPVYHYPDALAEYDRLRDAGAEGVVLRNPHAPYQDGRPKHGGHLLKFKFYSTAAVQVVGHNDQHSVRVAVRGDDGSLIEKGSVTLPPSQRKPPINAILDVRYLYAYRGGSLYQPTFQRVRDDVTVPDADATLSFKGEAAAA
jgi:bifunctional non-homologous end joining protein LigD